MAGDRYSDVGSAYKCGRHTPAIQPPFFSLAFHRPATTPHILLLEVRNLPTQWQINFVKAKTYREHHSIEYPLLGLSRSTVGAGAEAMELEKSRK